MKIAEQITEADGKVIHRRTFDPNPTLKRLRVLRDSGRTAVSDSVHVGTVPGWLVTEWLKEAGVRWDDPAANDIIERKLMDGDYSAFRNWKGTF